MDRARAAIRTARALMAKGLQGPDLAEALASSHPALTDGEKTKIAKAIRKEAGILGQVAHDPNQYRSCRQACSAKEQHPHSHTLLATYRTPMCGTCSLRRGSQCGLMGGTLIAGPEEINDKMVARTAALLVQDNQLDKSQAKRIALAQIPAAKRVGAMHLQKITRNPSSQEDAKAVSASRTAAAMLDNKDQTLTVNPSKLVGPAKIKNGERTAFRTENMDILPGDSNTEKRVRRTASVLAAMPMQIELPGEAHNQARQDIKLASRSVFDAPQVEARKVRASGDVEEYINQVQTKFNRHASLASKVLANGQMDLETATRFATSMDTLIQNGAVASKRDRQILQQLEALSGGLEM